MFPRPCTSRSRPRATRTGRPGATPKRRRGGDSLNQGLDGRGRVERRRVDVVVFDHRERDFLLDAHDLLGDGRRLRQPAELLIASLDGRHRQGAGKGLARIDTARAKPGGDVVKVEILHAINPLDSELVAGSAVADGLLLRFHGWILLRIAHLYLEVRVV